jgi:hypothetical protein
MSGWSSAESRIRSLGKKSYAVELGKRTSVVFYDPETGVVNWPSNAGDGVLLVPCQLTIEQWVEKYGQHGKQQV